MSSSLLKEVQRIPESVLTENGIRASRNSFGDILT
jgi:hypothetical protein